MIDVDFAIIGGGIAGLATALSLRQRGHEVVVFEQAPQYDREVGKGFLLMPNGADALVHLGLLDKVREVGCSAFQALHRSPDGAVQRNVRIPEHIGLLRGPLVDVLRRALPAGVIKTDCVFAGFEHSEGGRVACFENGERVRARVFVGADGIGSKVREEGFGEARKSVTSVRELVTVISDPKLSAHYAGWLSKIEDQARRRILGLFSIEGEKVLWYLRWDRRDQDLTDPSAEARRAFVSNMTEGWPDPTADLIEKTDFAKCVVLDSVMVELPPSFTYDNVVLVGDAAHALVRLTTQGISKALEDAILLADVMTRHGGDFEGGLQEFSQVRLPELQAAFEDGRRKIDAFLDPKKDLAAENPPGDLTVQTSEVTAPDPIQ